MNEFINIFTTVITNSIASTGYVAVFLLMAAESALIPIPSEITMPFGGFLASKGILNFWGVVLAGAVGNLVGSYLAWLLGTHGENFTRRFIKKYGKWVLISEHELEIAISWYRRFGQPITFFSRLLPVIRTYISLPAGVAKMPLAPFLIFTFAGSFLWSIFLTWLGVILGDNWHSLSIYFRKFDFAIVAVAALLVGLYLWYKLKKRS